MVVGFVALCCISLVYTRYTIEGCKRLRFDSRILTG